MTDKTKKHETNDIRNFIDGSMTIDIDDWRTFTKYVEKMEGILIDVALERDELAKKVKDNMGHEEQSVQSFKNLVQPDDKTLENVELIAKKAAERAVLVREAPTMSHSFLPAGAEERVRKIEGLCKRMRTAERKLREHNIWLNNTSMRIKKLEPEERENQDED